MQPPQTLERSNTDVQSRMHLLQLRFSHQRQTTDTEVRVQRVWMTVGPFSEAAHQTVLCGQNVAAVLLKVGVLEHV